MKNELIVKRFHDNALPLPSQHHDGDAGFDLRSRVDKVIAPYEQDKVPCGFGFAIPNGFVGIICDRSSMASKRIYSTGLIDSGYRGEVLMIIRNDSNVPFMIKIGDKITQMIVVPYYKAGCVEVSDFESDTDRGDSGFGSTG